MLTDMTLECKLVMIQLVLANLFSVEKLKHLEIQEKDLFNKNELFFCTKACL